MFYHSKTRCSTENLLLTTMPIGTLAKGTHNNMFKFNILPPYHLLWEDFMMNFVTKATLIHINSKCHNKKL